MKFLTKIIVVGVMAGAGGAALHAAPGDDTQVDDKQLSKERSMIAAAIAADSEQMEIVYAQASKDKDAIRLGCVNDKRVQMKPLLNIADGMASADLTTENVAAYRTQSMDIHGLVEAARACIDQKKLSSENANDFHTDGFIPPVDTIVGFPESVTDGEEPTIATRYD